jgi:hypothetical protein
MQRKTWYVFHFGGGRHASFPQKPVVKVKVMGSNSGYLLNFIFYFKSTCRRLTMQNTIVAIICHNDDLS